MRSIINQLKTVLLDKIEILHALIEGQDRMKDFLLAPKWEHYFDLVAPQGEFLKKLQDTVRSQQNLGSSLAQIFGLPPRTPMVQILTQCSARDRDELGPLFESSRKLAETLRAQGQLSDRLMQAQNEFTQHWVESWQHTDAPTLSLYNSFGYHVPRKSSSVFQREA